uniref:CEP63/Deup1 CEP152 binding coiled coil domain-containing protein n=1 Tax=Podarcis muralis TaxID=64176 RepID=A0A670HX85_PODMU
LPTLKFYGSMKIKSLILPYLLQIRDRLYQEEQSHRSEVERMRTEISDLTEELHQKEITIATIMEKAALLERQLQTELEIKEKMLGKQQVCKQNKKQRTSFDLSKKEYAAYSDSIDKLERQSGMLRNDLAKLPKDKEMPLRVNPIMYFGRNCAKQTAVKVEEPGLGLEPEGPSPVPDPQEQTPAKSALAPEVIEDPLPTETPFAATVTEKFLQEEERRARDFEQVLNSHIEELQRQSENTIKKYTAFKQSRHR